jgi:hypothetical protein
MEKAIHLSSHLTLRRNSRLTGQYNQEDKHNFCNILPYTPTTFFYMILLIRFPYFILKKKIKE